MVSVMMEVIPHYEFCLLHDRKTETEAPSSQCHRGSRDTNKHKLYKNTNILYLFISEMEFIWCNNLKMLHYFHLILNILPFMQFKKSNICLNSPLLFYLTKRF